VTLKGVRLSEETKKKMRESHLKSPVAIEQTKRLHEIMKGRNWDRGKRHQSMEQRKNNSERQKGLQAGDKNPMWGKKHSEETKRKCGLGRKGKPSPNKGKYLSDETKQKLSIARVGKYAGDKCPRWKGGVSYEPYCPRFTKEFKERVRAFFGYQCIECGSLQCAELLHVHHVSFNKQSCCDSTLPLFVPLCRPCHSKTGHNREYWKKYFTDIITHYYGGKCYFTKEEMAAFCEPDPLP
jgi:hypothetical protein